VKTLINITLAIIVIVLVVIWLVAEPPLSSPLGDGFFSSSLPTENQTVVYGFLPYWNLDEATIQPELTHLAYFALGIEADGTITTQLDSGGTEPGYYQLQSTELLSLFEEARQNRTQAHVVLSQFDNDQITEFLTSPAAQETFLQSIDSLLLAYPFNGLNLDIEYLGDAPPEVRQAYTAFIKKVRSHLDQKYQNVTLTVDVYAAAATKNLLWEVAEIAPLVDYLIIMAYDFHRSSSPTAGPVAPLLQKEAGWGESINGYLQDFAQQAPTEKLLLGIPFYGYEWQTTSLEPASFTFPRTGATASYKRVKELLAQQAELGIEEHWDESALAPYLSYEKDGDYYLVYYENPLSISYKLEYARQLDLAGIAIWSLGYEGNSRDLWDSIGQALEIEN